MVVTLRQATEADIETIAAIQTAAIWSIMDELEPGSHSHPGYYEMIALNTKNDAASDWHFSTIAESGGIPIAAIVLELSPPLISGLWVRPEHQAKGIGPMLMSSAIDTFIKRGDGFVSLAVHPRNFSALTLYKRFGFELIKEKTVFSRGLQRDLPQWIMQRAL